MAARRIIQRVPKIDPRVRRVIALAPIWAPCLIVVLFVGFVAWPFAKELASAKRKIDEKENYVVTVSRGVVDLERMKQELDAFRLKVDEFESRLPVRKETTLIIETLEEVTRGSKLQFSLLEPAPIRRHVLKETNDVFVELPIKVRLRCGYYDLIDFLKKIEEAQQLMKISNLSIKDDSRSAWEHDVEFHITVFSKLEQSDEAAR